MEKDKKIGDIIVVKEYFTEYNGVIVAIEKDYYTVEANGHKHFVQK